MSDWHTAAELAGTPGMPRTESGTIRRAKREGWTSRKRPGRGGGREYHINSLPAETRSCLLGHCPSGRRLAALRLATARTLRRLARRLAALAASVEGGR